MEHDSTIALFSVVGSGTFILLAAWIGGKFTKHFRNEDLYRDIGRIESRGDSPRSNFELAMMLGGLRTGVATLQEDIGEIKNRQEANRERQDEKISEVSDMMQTVHADINSLKTQFADLRRSVAGLARGMRQKNPTH